MLIVHKEKRGTVTIARLVGNIDERIELEKLIGTIGPELHIYCKEVPRINSHGIRNWVKYFDQLSKKGVKFKFFECSPALVEQFDLIMNFGGLGSIESVCVPYLCMSCKSQFMTVAQVAELRKSSLALPDLKCPRCAAGRAVFDDIADEYFMFLRRL